MRTVLAQQPPSLVFYCCFLSFSTDLNFLSSCLTDAVITFKMTSCSGSFGFKFFFAILKLFTCSERLSRSAVLCKTCFVPSFSHIRSNFLLLLCPCLSDSRAEFVLPMHAETAAFRNSCTNPVRTNGLKPDGSVPLAIDCPAPSCTTLLAPRIHPTTPMPSKATSTTSSNRYNAFSALSVLTNLFFQTSVNNYEQTGTWSIVCSQL